MDEITLVVDFDEEIGFYYFSVRLNEETVHYRPGFRTRAEAERIGDLWIREHLGAIPKQESEGVAGMVETIVYYSIQRVGSFGVMPSPINRRWEKEAAEKQARQTVKVTTGDLQIVVFVCGDDITDPEIYEQTNFLKTAALGLVPDFHTSDYSENPAGEGFIYGEPEADWVEDEGDEM